MALQALKRKKNHEKKLQQIDGTLTTLEYQRDALDAASTNTAVLQAMGKPGYDGNGFVGQCVGK